jgi:hypothetical protein
MLQCTLVAVNTHACFAVAMHPPQASQSGLPVVTVAFAIVVPSGQRAARHKVLLGRRLHIKDGDGRPTDRSRCHALVIPRLDMLLLRQLLGVMAAREVPVAGTPRRSRLVEGPPMAEVRIEAVNGACGASAVDFVALLGAWVLHQLRRGLARQVRACKHNVVAHPVNLTGCLQRHA